MKLYVLKFIFLVGFLCACTQEIKIIPSDQIEVFCSLESGQKAFANISNIYAIGQKVDSSRLFQNNAELYLTENGFFFDSLKNTGKGLYYSSKLIRESENYILHGKIGDSISFYSEVVKIPAAPEKLNYIYLKNVKNIINPQTKANFIQFNFKDYSSKDLTISIFPYNNADLGDRVLGVFYYSENTEKLIKDCSFSTHAINNVAALKNSRILNTNCLPYDTLSYLLESSFLKADPTPPFNSEVIMINSFLLTYSNTTEDFFLWAQNRSQQPEGQERFSEDPVVNYTNLHGAQGIVFGLNTKKEILK